LIALGVECARELLEAEVERQQAAAREYVRVSCLSWNTTF
jgi:hypothetical protein